MVCESKRRHGCRSDGLCTRHLLRLSTQAHCPLYNRVPTSCERKVQADILLGSHRTQVTTGFDFVGFLKRVPTYPPQSALWVVKFPITRNISTPYCYCTKFRRLADY